MKGKKLLSLLLLTGMLASCRTSSTDGGDNPEPVWPTSSESSSEHDPSHEGSDSESESGSDSGSGSESSSEGDPCVLYGHKLHHYLAQEPTCTEEGYKEAWYCNECDNLYFEKPAKVQSTTETNKPLASDPRTHIHPEGHKYPNDGAYIHIKDASCTENGSELRTCSVCGYEDKKVLPLTGHNYGDVDYEWDFDNMQITATMECPNGVPHEKKETVRIVEVSNTKGTCNTVGSIKYRSVAFKTDKKFTVQEYTKTTPKQHKLEYHPAEASYCVYDEHGHAGHTAYYRCIGGCGKYFADDKASVEITLNSTYLAVDPNNHVALENVVAREATCFQVGYNAHQECLACGAKIDYNPIPMVAHTADTSKWASDSSDHYRLCKNCSAIIGVTRVAHTPDGTDTSVDIHCTICNHLISPGTGEHTHNFEFKVQQDATCTSTGLKQHYECACGKYFSEANEASQVELETLIIEKEPHDYKYHAAVEGNCTVDSYAAYYSCPKCDKLFKKPASEYIEIASLDEIKTEATGHVPSGEWTSDVEYHWHNCSVCSTPGAKTLHTPDHDVNLEPNYEGLIKCSVCDYVLRSAEHHYCRLHTELHSANAASCSANGNSAYYECTVCHKYYSDANAQNEIAENSWVIPMTDHEVNTSVWMTNTTQHWHQCANCDHKEDVGGHYNPQIDDPTYEGEVRCLTCNYVMRNPIGHTHSYQHHDAVPATCTTAGNIEYYTCSSCSKYFTSDGVEYTEVSQASTIVPATGHEYGDWVIDTAAGCTTDGLRTKTCIHGDDTIEEVIPAKGHSLVKYDATSPSCTETGNYDYWKCTNCGKYYSDANAETETTLEAVTIANLGGHEWAVNTELYNNGFKFSKDGHSATVYLTCSKTTGRVHSHEETVTLGDGITSEETLAATCTTKGKTTYTASYLGKEASVEIEDIDALDHDYEYKGIDIDSSYETATVNFTCKHNNAHTATVIIGGTDITSEVTTAATCTTKAKTTYTATIKAADSLDGDLHSKVFDPVETGDILGHNWVYDNITMTDDGKSSAAHYHCDRCAETKDINATITKVTKIEPTCEDMGTRTYTGTVSDDKDPLGVERTISKDVVDIAALGHAWVGPYYVWESGSDSSIKSVNVCDNVATHYSDPTATSYTNQIRRTSGYTATTSFEISSDSMSDLYSAKTTTQKFGDINIHFTNYVVNSSGTQTGGKGMDYDAIVDMTFVRGATGDPSKNIFVKLDNSFWYTNTKGHDGKSYVILYSDLSHENDSQSKGFNQYVSELKQYDSLGHESTADINLDETFKTAFLAFTANCRIVVRTKYNASTQIAVVTFTYYSNVAPYSSTDNEYYGYTQTFEVKYSDDDVKNREVNSVRINRNIEGSSITINKVYYYYSIDRDIVSYTHTMVYYKPWLVSAYDTEARTPIVVLNNCDQELHVY